MIAILKIGCAEYAIEPKDAAKVMELLGKAVRIEHGWVDHKKVYYPAEERSFYDDLGMEMVNPSCLLQSKPKEDEPLPPSMSVRSPKPQPRRLNGTSRPLLGLPGFRP